MSVGELVTQAYAWDSSRVISTVIIIQFDALNRPRSGIVLLGVHFFFHEYRRKPASLMCENDFKIPASTAIEAATVPTMCAVSHYRI